VTAERETQRNLERVRERNGEKKRGRVQAVKNDEKGMQQREAEK